MSILTVPQSTTYFDRYDDSCVVGKNCLITRCNEINGQIRHVNDVGCDHTLGSAREMNYDTYGENIYTCV